MRQVGLWKRNAGKFDESISLLSRSRDTLLILEEKGAVQVGVEHQLAQAQFWIGYVLVDVGRNPDALSPLRDSLRRLEMILEHDPINMEMRQPLSGTHGRLALALAGIGTEDEAIHHAHAAVDIARALNDDSPDNQRTFRNLEIAQSFLGAALVALGEQENIPAERSLRHWRAAKETYQKALSMTLERIERSWLPLGEAHYPDQSRQRIESCDTAIANIQRQLTAGRSGISNK